ncbi:MAG: cupin domain-containing protein [Planctomycetota bacterium]|nr:cupin domain-containing protein [Planctomycetota bacterium]
MTDSTSSKKYRVARLDEIDAIACPCGQTRRAFVAEDNPIATLHLVDISRDSRAHHHQALTEIYLVLEGQGHMELDNDIIPLKPMTAVLIKPGCRHRAVGNLRIVNIAVPAFDPHDEWFE